MRSAVSHCPQRSHLSVAVALLVLVSGFNIFAATPDALKRVLLVYQDEMRLPGEQAVDSGIRSVFGNALSIQIYSEHLDQSLFPDPGFQKEQLDWFRRKYSDRKIDLIIAVGVVPTDLLPGVPVVFCCREPIGLPSRTPDVTGVWLSADFRGTLEAARRLQPDARRVVVLSGSTAFDRQGEARFTKEAQRIGGGLDFGYWDDLSVNEIRTRLSKLPSNTIVLYLDIQRDGAGHPFISRDLLPSLSAASSAPMYGLAEDFVGFGIVGGSVLDLQGEGKQAAELGLRILRGENPSDIPPVYAASKYVFDWRQLHRFGLSERALPPGSIVQFKPFSVWEHYKRWIIVGLALLFLESGFIVHLILQRKRRRRAEASLEYELRFESLLSELSARFVNLRLERVDGEIEDALEKLRNFLGLDRVSLFEILEGAHFALMHSASLADRSPIPRTFRGDSFPWLVGNMLAGKECVIQGLDNLPLDATNERAFVRERNYKFLALIPLQAGGRVLGNLAFASLRSVGVRDKMIQQLRIIGEVFSNVLVRKRADGALRYSENLKGAILASLSSNVAVLDVHATIISVNRSWMNFGPVYGAFCGSRLSAGMNYLEACQELAAENASYAGLVRNGISAVLAGDTQEFEMEYPCYASGETIWFLMSVTVLKNEAGGLVVAHKDITDRKRAEENLRELSGRLINAQEDERARIARELHDDFSQRLAVVANELAQLSEGMPAEGMKENERLQIAWERLTELSSDIHRLSHRLHSAKLQYVGLLTATRSICEETARQHRIQIEFGHHSMPEDISPEVSLCFFRIIQEALNNIVKHSGAKQARLDFVGSPDGIRLRIVDAGVGFDSTSRVARSGLGLASMRERLRLLGGTMAIHSRPTEGTEILAEVPLAQSSAYTRAVYMTGNLSAGD
jgi:signal transduction histidine kinase